MSWQAQASLIDRLDWDSSFFGLPIGRVKEGVVAGQIGAVVGEARQRRLCCAYLLAPADDIELVAAAEEHGFRVREIRIELQRPVPSDTEAISSLRVGDIADLVELAPIARDRIRGTRFFADRQFGEKSAELYVEWLHRGLTGGPERQTLVAGRADGFIVCHLDDVSGVGTIELIAVADGAARKGVGRALIAGAEDFFRKASMGTARVVTQGSNIEAQRLYQACGYRTERVSYWLHIWMPAAAAL